MEKKLLDSTEKFATYYFETSSKREIQKTAEDVVDLICYKINNNIRQITSNKPKSAENITRVTKFCTDTAVPTCTADEKFVEIPK